MVHGPKPSCTLRLSSLSLGISSSCCLGSRFWYICTSLSHVLVLVPPEVDSETRIVMQIISLGGAGNTSRGGEERAKEEKIAKRWYNQAMEANWSLTPGQITWEPT